MSRAGFRQILLVLALWPALLGMAGAEVKLPAGYIIPFSSISPDGRYGVCVFDHADPEPDEIDHAMLDLQTGRELGKIEAWPARVRMNRGGILPTRWSPDGHLLLWEVEGRWSPWALTLVKIEDGKIQWQRNLLESGQQALLARTKEAAGEAYEKARVRNQGNGSAFPDGFTVNVRVDGDKPRGALDEKVKGKPISLPLRLRAELTSNPKGIAVPDVVQLDSALEAVVDQDGKLKVTRFWLHRKPYASALSDSWLEMTHPAKAAAAALEYGDRVGLEGRVKKRKEDGQTSYYLLLAKPISIPASDEFAMASGVLTIKLLELEKSLNPDGAADGRKNVEVWGMLNHSSPGEKGPSVTLKVSSYGY